MNAMPPDPALARVASFRARMWDSGFRPVAIYNIDAPTASPAQCGKAPKGTAWQLQARLDTPSAVRQAPEPDALNTGLLADGLRLVDVDVDDATVAGRVKALALALLGDAPIRWRANSGRVLLPYRAAEGEPGKLVVAGSAGKLEVLGRGQQAVVDGLHPTGATIQWEPDPPGAFTRDSLVAVTEAQVAAFLAAAGPLIGVEQAVAAGQGTPGLLPRTSSAHGPGADPLDVAAALAVIPNEGAADWEAWNRVGMAAWGATGGSASGFAAWCAWSERHPAHDPAACTERWTHYASSPPSRIGAGTLFRLARDARPDWRRPSDAQAAGHRRRERKVEQKQPSALDVSNIQPADRAPEAPATTTPNLEDADASIVSGESVEAPDLEPAAPGMSDAEVDAEIERLSRLPGPEYARTRKRAAQDLAMGVGELDGFVDRKRAARRAEAQARFREQPPPAAGEVRWPFGVFQREDGLYADTSDEAPPTWLCDPLEVLGLGRDAASESWGLFLRWRDADRHVHTWPMPAKMTMVQPGELEAALVDRGLRINGDTNARMQLRRALTGVQSGSRVVFADAPGWSAPGAGPAVYTLIDGTVIGEAAEHIVLKAPPENAAHKLRTAGTLDTWKQEVAAKAEGNPGAAFAICMAFAGTLLEPLGEASGGFHFHGKSKAGKTLAMRMGISVWGATKKSGLLRDWRSTSNALEGAAEECNDGFLPLDEVHQADPKEVVGAVYQLANESGKGRLSRDAIARKRRTWRTVVLSTGEHTIAQMAAKAGQPLPAGAEVRLPSVPTDGQDLWPCLHGAPTPHALMAQVQQALLTSYGTPIRAFLARLTTVLAANDGTLEAAIELQRDAFYARLPADADGQVKDVARRCALIALAGELAIEWRILPWMFGEAIEAAEIVMDWWIGRRGGTGSTEESQHVRAVRAYLSEFRLSRFIPLRWETDARNIGRWVEQNPENRILSISGWRRTVKDQEEGAEEFILDGDGWEKLCAASGADPVEVAKTLAAAGHLDVDADGRNLMKKVRMPGRKAARFYVVRETIFAASGDQAPADEIAA